MITILLLFQDKEIVNHYEKSHVLILKAISPKIGQTYTCIADNGVGVVTADIIVHVLCK